MVWGPWEVTVMGGDSGRSGLWLMAVDTVVMEITGGAGCDSCIDEELKWWFCWWW